MSHWARENRAFGNTGPQFDTVWIPPAVQDELGYALDWLVVKRVQNVALAKALRMKIDRGESETIALAAELGEVFVVLDDKKARRVAQEIGLKVTGTVGVLLRAKKKGIVMEIKPILDALNDADFRISKSLYQQALLLAREV